MRVYPPNTEEIALYIVTTVKKERKKERKKEEKKERGGNAFHMLSQRLKSYVSMYVHMLNDYHMFCTSTLRGEREGGAMDLQY